MKKLNQKGFTLIEMMIVLIVISVLTLLVLPNASKYINKANEEGCEAYQASIEAQNVASQLIDGTPVTADSQQLTRLCGLD